MQRLLQWCGLVLAGALMATDAHAQCPDTLLYEDFQSQSIPATWINIDNDGSADANGRPQDWYTRVDVLTTTAGDTNYVATASSWFSPAGQASNWLIMDSIIVCSPDIVMEWKSAPFEGIQYADGYKVLVSTTGNQPADFTDTLEVFAEDVTGGGVWGTGVQHTLFSGTNGVLQSWRRSLGAYSGDTIYIAFVHDSDDDNLISIDDIFVGQLPSNDLSLTTFGGMEYPMVPMAQVPAIAYNGTIFNNAGPGSNPVLQVDVSFMGMSTFAGSSTPMGMLAQGTSMMASVSTTHMPSMTGLYTVMGWVTSDSIDVIPGNDSMMFSYMVTDTVYAREMGPSTGDLSIGATNFGFLGQEFEIVQVDDLTSVSYYRAEGTLTDSMRVVVYDLDAMGMPDSIIYRSDWIVETDTTAGWRLHQLGMNYITLSPDTYVVGVEEVTATSSRIGTNPAYFVPGKAWVFFNAAWNNAETFNFNIAYLIRPNFGIPMVIGVEEVEAPAMLTVFPQPVGDQLTIDLDKTAEQVTIYNTNGAIAKQFIQPNSNTLLVSELGTGVYIIEVELDGERLYSRFTKQ